MLLLCRNAIYFFLYCSCLFFIRTYLLVLMVSQHRGFYGFPCKQSYCLGILNSLSLSHSCSHSCSLSLLLSFQILTYSSYFPHLTVLPMASCALLNIKVTAAALFLFLTLNISSLGMMFAEGFCRLYFIILRRSPSIPSFLGTFLNQEFVLKFTKCSFSTY